MMKDNREKAGLILILFIISAMALTVLFLSWELTQKPEDPVCLVWHVEPVVLIFSEEQSIRYVPLGGIADLGYTVTVELPIEVSTGKVSIGIEYREVMVCDEYVARWWP